MKRFTSKRLIKIGATFAVALGTGFVVQYGDALASRWGADEPVTGPEARAELEEGVVVPLSANVVPSITLPQETATVPTPVVFEADVVPSEELAPTFIPVSTSLPDEIVAEPSDVMAEPIMSEPAMIEEIAEMDCKIEMTAIEMKLAMVQLSLSAPCRAGESVVIHHDGLMFSAMTDETGSVTLNVPALSFDAFFIAAFDGGEGAIAQTDVPNFADYDRAVLQWQGDMGVELHALEFGATYGDEGHRWSQSVGSFAGAATGVNGIVTRLGDDSVSDPLMAEIYTFPSGINSQDGSINLSVEAAVTSGNCGQVVSAQTIQLRQAEDAQVMNLTMSMPGCEAVGEYLILKNMLEDLTLASK